MSKHSRRDFLRGVGVTAAAATVAAIVPTGIASASEHTATDDDNSPTPDGPVVVYVKDPKAGSVAVMKGENETVIVDKVLARKLAKLAR